MRGTCKLVEVALHGVRRQVNEEVVWALGVRPVLAQVEHLGGREMWQRRW